MPIVEVEIVAGESLPSELAADLAAGLAEILRGPPGGTWVRLRRLRPSHYAEGDGGPPAGVHPIFVTILRADLPSGEARRDEASRIAGVVAEACARPRENVHVFYQPAGRGRVAFGGELVE